MSGESADQLPTRRVVDQERGYDVVATDRLKGYEGWVRSIFETVREHGISEEQAQKEIAVAMATLALQRDVAEEEERTANELAKRDALTGLYNRTYLDEILGKMTTENTPFAAIMLDVDHFKEFNDQYGHPAGDVALVEVALTLAGKMRGGDVLIRYGGEEILAILPGVTDEAIVKERGKTMVEVMGSRKINIDGKQINITLSAGGATLRQGEAPLDLIGRADAALYEAKRKGRNQMVLSPAVQ